MKNLNESVFVTIGLPVFNAEKFLAKTIDGILAQDYHNYELIISDNASEDGSSEICKSYFDRDRRITYLRNEVNVGPLRNSTKILDSGSGDYFVFAADHDLWHPRFLSSLVDELNRDESIVLCYPRMVFIDTEDNVVHGKDFDIVDTRGLEPVDRFKKMMWGFRGYSNMCYGLYRTSCLRKIWKERNVIGPDNVLMAEVGLHGAVGFVDEPLFFLRLQRIEEETTKDGCIPRQLEWFCKNPYEVLIPWTMHAQEHIKIVRDSSLSLQDKELLFESIRDRYTSTHGATLFNEAITLVEQGTAELSSHTEYAFNRIIIAQELIRLTPYCSFFCPEASGELSRFESLCLQICNPLIDGNSSTGGGGQCDGNLREATLEIALRLAKEENRLLQDKIHSMRNLRRHLQNLAAFVQERWAKMRSGQRRRSSAKEIDL